MNEKNNNGCMDTCCHLCSFYAKATDTERQRCMGRVVRSPCSGGFQTPECRLEIERSFELSNNGECYDFIPRPGLDKET